MHRAVFLARSHPNAQVLLTTFSATLAKALSHKLQLRAGHGPEVMKRITVRPMTDVALELYSREFGEPKLAADSVDDL
jgi:hypothetical protein